MVDGEMIAQVEAWTDDSERRVSLPPEFVVPGGGPPRSARHGEGGDPLAPSGGWCRT